MLSVLATATEHMTLATKGQNGTYAEAQRMLGFTTNKTFSGAGEKLTAAAAPLSLSDGPGPDDAPEPVRPWKRHQVTGRGCEHAHSLPVFVYVGGGGECVRGVFVGVLSSARGCVRRHSGAGPSSIHTSDTPHTTLRSRYHASDAASSRPNAAMSALALAASGLASPTAPTTLA